MDFAQRKAADEAAEARATALVDTINDLARATAIAERNGVTRLANSELAWMASPEGTAALRAWRRFRDLVEIFDTTMTVDFEQELARERGQR